MDAKNLPVIEAVWDYDRPQITELKFRKLLPVAERSGNLPYYAELLTQLARTLSLQRKFEEAHETLNKAAQLIREEDMSLTEIRYLLERGRTFNSANEKDNAIVLFQDAYNRALTHNEDFYAVDAAHMLGIAEKPEARLHWNITAMQLAEKSADVMAKKWLGSLYNNIGWTYHDLNDYNPALIFFEKALAWRAAQKDDRGVFIANWTVGRTYRSLNRIDEALKIQNGLLEEVRQKNLAPSGFVFEELAECLLTKGELKKAKTYFKKAFELLSKDVWLKANEPYRLERLHKLGNFQ